MLMERNEDRKFQNFTIVVVKICFDTLVHSNAHNSKSIVDVENINTDLTSTLNFDLE